MLSISYKPRSTVGFFFLGGIMSKKEREVLINLIEDVLKNFR